MASGGTRLVHSREMKVIGTTEPLGPGTTRTPATAAATHGPRLRLGPLTPADRVETSSPAKEPWAGTASSGTSSRPVSGMAILQPGDRRAPSAPTSTHITEVRASRVGEPGRLRSRTLIHRRLEDRLRGRVTRGSALRRIRVRAAHHDRGAKRPEEAVWSVDGQPSSP